MINVKMENLSFEDLKTLKRNVGIALLKRKKQMISDARREVDAAAHEIAERRGLSARALLKPSQPTNEPKYYNIEDPDLTWTGRGRKPNWIIAHIDAGGSLDELRIPQPPSAEGVSAG